MFLPPPPYIELYTNEAKNDPLHEDHALFKPPPPIKAPFVKLGVEVDPTQFRRLYIAAPPMIEFLPAKDYVGGLSPPVTLDDALQQLQHFSPNIDYASNLRRLIKTLMEVYVDLLRALLLPRTDSGMAPYEVRMRHVEHILLNILHILNMLRRHQAREGLIAMMQKQVQATVAKAEALEARRDVAVSFLKAHGYADVEDTLPSKIENEAISSSSYSPSSSSSSSSSSSLLLQSTRSILKRKSPDQEVQIEVHGEELEQGQKGDGEVDVGS